jgi:anti-sigma B factor antagonist
VNHPPTSSQPSRSQDTYRSATNEGAVLAIRQEKTAEGLTVIHLVGEFDTFTVGEFRRAIANLPGASRLVIDMSNVPFMDFAGLGALIGAIRRTRELGGDVALACAPRHVERLLRTTGIERMVRVADTVPEAAASVARVSAGPRVEGPRALREAPAKRDDREVPDRANGRTVLGSKQPLTRADINDAAVVKTAIDQAADVVPHKSPPGVLLSKSRKDWLLGGSAPHDLVRAGWPTSLQPGRRR